MRYWILTTSALVGGFLLLNGALKHVLPFVSRVELLLAIICVGAGRRMVQSRLHGVGARRTGGFVILATALSLGAPGSAHGQRTPDSSGFVQVDGGSIFFEVWGDGAPTVLIHGGMVDRTMWDDQVEVLAEDLMAIRFDMRGAGESPVSEPYYPAEDVIALLDHLGITRANIVGLSNGGAVAIDFALAHPDRVSALVLAEPGVTGYQFGPQVMQTMTRAARQMRERDYVAAVATLLAAPAFAYTRENNLDSFARITGMVQANLQSFAMFPRYRWHEANAIRALERIGARTLVLVSENAERDALTIAEELSNSLSHVQRATIPDAGHMMNLDNPAAFNGEVLRFLMGR